VLCQLSVRIIIKLIYYIDKQSNHKKKPSNIKQKELSVNSDLVSPLKAKSSFGDSLKGNNIIVIVIVPKNDESVEVSYNKANRKFIEHEVDLDLEKVIEDAGKKHKRKHAPSNHPNLKKKDFENKNRNMSNSKQMPNILSRQEKKNFKSVDRNIEYKTRSESTHMDKSHSGSSANADQRMNANIRYHNDLPSPTNLDMKSNRSKHYPDRERMEFLSQPRKLQKDKKKRKRRKLMFKESTIFPTINTNAEVKNSLLNLAKAKIYGVQVDRFPQLVEYKEKISEYKKKIKMQRLRDRPNRTNKLSLETIANNTHAVGLIEPLEPLEPIQDNDPIY
jgi:hypothetical protein